MKKTKRIVFALVVLLVSILNYKLMHGWNYFDRIIIRLPQVLVLLYVYRKYIYYDTNNRKFWRIKNNILHYGLLVLGVTEFVAVIVIGNIYLKDVTINVNLFDFTDPNFYISILESLVIAFPIYYALIQYGLLLFKLNLWAYERNKFMLIPIMIMDDLFFTLVFSSIG